jgi:hypothetical protein
LTSIFLKKVKSWKIAYEKMFIIIGHWGNENQVWNDIPLHTHWIGFDEHQKLTIIWKNRDIHTLLAGKKWCSHRGYSKITCTSMFIAALFTIAKLWKQPTTYEWIKKMWYLSTMEFYSAMKKMKSYHL